MNRLSPLIVRRVGRFAPAPAWEPAEPLFTEERGAKHLEDVKQFAVGWLGGLVFFGTFLS